MPGYIPVTFLCCLQNFYSYWYVDHSLSGGTTKIDRQRSISAVGGRLREKKGRRRRGKEERRRRGEEIPRAVLARTSSLPAGCSRAIFLPCGEKDRGDVAPRVIFPARGERSRRPVRPRTALYVSVRQLIGTLIGCYRAVLSKGDCRRSIEEKSRREEEEEEEKKKEEEEAKEKRYLEPPSPARRRCRCRPHIGGTHGSPASQNIGKAPYRPVHTGLAADRYADRSLPGGIAKIGCRQLISTVGDRFRPLAVDFGCRRSIVGEIDRRLSIEEGKGKRRRGKEERRSSWPPSLPARCPRALVARGSTASRCHPRRPRVACEMLPPSQPASDYHPCAGRRNVCPCWESDRG
ncbi:hypothetical protein BHE74_00033480, partial [Ensete ventricosum]